MWVSICSGIHLDNPPYWLAHIVQPISKILFRKTKDEQFLIRAILQGLGLEKREEMSPLGSPRSPTSPRSPSRSPGTSPGGSPRRGFDSPSPMDSPGRQSVRSDNSPTSYGRTTTNVMHSPTSSPHGNSPSGGNSPRSLKYTAAQASKQMKNFGSVKRVLRELDTGDGDSTARTPTSPQGIFSMTLDTSARSGKASSRKSSRFAGASAAHQTGRLVRRALNFVRMPDGTHASLDEHDMMANTTMKGSATIGAEDISPRSSISPGTSVYDLKTTMTSKSVVTTKSRGSVSPGRSDTSPDSPGRSDTSPGDDESLSRRARLVKRLRRYLCCCRSRKKKAKKEKENKMHKLLLDRKHRHLLNITKLDLSDYGHRSITELDHSPQQLWDKVPRPPPEFTVSRVVRDCKRALRVSMWTIFGQWSEPRNVGPLHIRTRTRDLARYVWRGNVDADDYLVVERASA